MAKITQQEVRQILFITLSNIGDAILTTPVLEALHQRFPQAAIDLVTDQRSSIVFNHCPYRGQIFHKNKKTGWLGLLQLIYQLRHTSYDLIVDLRTDGLAYLLKGQKRLTKWQAKPVGNHAVERHMAVIASLLSPSIAIPPCRIWLQTAQIQFAKKQLSQLTGNRWLALGPGANWAPKIWPISAFTVLIQTVQEYFDGVIFVGSLDDRERSQGIAANLSLSWIDLCGRTDLLQAAAVLQQANVFVGNDSGLGHLAAAVGTPTFTVFGPGHPEHYHPWGKYSHWQVAPNNKLQALSGEAIASQVIKLATYSQETY